MRPSLSSCSGFARTWELKRIYPVTFSPGKTSRRRVLVPFRSFSRRIRHGDRSCVLSETLADRTFISMRYARPGSGAARQMNKKKEDFAAASQPIQSLHWSGRQACLRLQSMIRPHRQRLRRSHPKHRRRPSSAIRVSGRGPNSDSPRAPEAPPMFFATSITTNWPDGTISTPHQQLWLLGFTSSLRLATDSERDSM